MFFYVHLTKTDYTQEEKCEVSLFKKLRFRGTKIDNVDN